MNYKREKELLLEKLFRFPELAAILETDVMVSENAGSKESEENFRMPYTSPPLRTGTKWNMSKSV